MQHVMFHIWLLPLLMTIGCRPYYCVDKTPFLFEVD